MALTAEQVKNNLVKPQIVGENETLEIIDGRHPIVEAINKNGFITERGDGTKTDRPTTNGLPRRLCC